MGAIKTKERRGVYREHWSDWFTLRRVFAIETEIKDRAIARDLAEGSTPPPPDGNPLTVTTPVALATTADSATLFEINVARGIPFGEGHYISFQAVGRITENPDNDTEKKWIVRGEIRPMRGAVWVYAGMTVVLSLWVIATVTSAAVSNVGTYAAVWVALITTALMGLYMTYLQLSDHRRLRAILRAITNTER